MEIVRAWDEDGVKIPKPFARTIKVLLAPDRHNVPDLTFSFALIEPGGQTDYHSHDRPELIFVVSGKGKSICEGEIIHVKADMILWVRTGEMHQVINTGARIFKLATVFIPAYTASENYQRCLDAAAQAGSG